MNEAIAVKELPILMQGNMVSATLADLKINTRRVIKPQPPSVEDVHARTGAGFSLIQSGYTSDPDKWHIAGSVGVACEMAGLKNDYQWKCPYGKPGDRLWVRETHCRYGVWCENGYTRTGKRRWKFKAYTKEVRYLDNPPDKILTVKGYKVGWYKIPSIHMPRWASRINLEITGIRVERVQDISFPDMKAEGLLPPKGMTSTKECIWLWMQWVKLWDSINAKRGYAWKDNPWVWVVEFKRVTA